MKGIENEQFNFEENLRGMGHLKRMSCIKFTFKKSDLFNEVEYL